MAPTENLLERCHNLKSAHAEYLAAKNAHDSFLIVKQTNVGSGAKSLNDIRISLAKVLDEKASYYRSLPPCQSLQCREHPKPRPVMLSPGQDRRQAKGSNVSKRRLTPSSDDEQSPAHKFITIEDPQSDDSPTEDDIDMDKINSEYELDDPIPSGPQAPFQKPPKRHVARTKPAPLPKTNSKPPARQNRYQPLADLAQQEPDTPSNQRDSIPSIMVDIIGHVKETCERITALVQNEPDFRINGERIMVTFKTVDDYRQGTKAMREKDIGFYTTNTTKSKPIKVVMKGLPLDYNSQELKDQLIEKEFPVERVVQLRRFKDGRPLPMFQITLSQAPGIDKIYEITKFDYLTVSVEKFARTGRVNQCYRCQSFFHSSQNCDFKPRCVKCGKDHESKDCTKTPDETPTCANCNGPHPASYRGCPKFPKWDKRSLASGRQGSSRPLPGNENRPTFSSRRHNWGAPSSAHLSQNRIQTPDTRECQQQNVTPPIPSPNLTGLDLAALIKSNADMVKELARLNELISEMRKDMETLRRERDQALNQVAINQHHNASA